MNVFSRASAAAQNHHDYREHSVNHGGQRSYRDERIHIRSARKQFFKAADIVNSVYRNDRQRENKFKNCKLQRVFIARKKRRQMQTYHMPHGKIHYGDKEREGDCKPEKQISSLFFVVYFLLFLFFGESLCLLHTVAARFDGFFHVGFGYLFLVELNRHHA